VAAFQNFLRVPPEMFRELEERLAPRLRRVGCNYRKPLEPGIMLAITMRHLATGDSYHSLMYGFRVAHNTISKVVRQVCTNLTSYHLDACSTRICNVYKMYHV
jgi:acyl-CoA thioesterase FadM